MVNNVGENEAKWTKKQINKQTNLIPSKTKRNNNKNKVQIFAPSGGFFRDVKKG